MLPLLLDIVAFLAFVIAHLIVWRLFRLSAHYKLLVLLGAAAFTGVTAVLWMNPISDSLRIDLDASGVGDLISAAVVYGAIVLAYVTTFSAVQADSPSMLILLSVDAAGEAGLPASEVEVMLNDDRLILPRIHDLVEGRLVKYANSRYVIEPPGAFTARVFLWYRALLRMERGG